MFKQIAHSAGFSGLLAALLLTLLQAIWVTPLIIEAEGYEGGDSSEMLAHDHAEADEAAGHSHSHGDDEAWAPEDGLERTLYTALSNLVVAIGFALILCGLYSLRPPQQLWHGLLWGLAGFAVFSLAPSLGLPPELPGTAAADLLLRQYWWIATAACTAVGLALLIFARGWPLKLLGLALLPLPHLVGAPHPQEHSSLAPAALQDTFISSALLVNAAFWVALGLLSSWLFRRNG